MLALPEKAGCTSEYIDFLGLFPRGEAKPCPPFSVPERKVKR